MPIFSLPSDFGIGSLGQDACDFVDFLQSAGVRVWEIMPIGHTDGTFSPHSTISAYAGNPLLIDLQEFVELGVFTGKELARMDWGRDRGKINYQKVAEAKYRALERVFETLYHAEDPDFVRFCRENEDWLEDYSRFAAIREHFQFLPLQLWASAAAARSENELLHLSQLLEVRIRFYQYLQYIFFRQWERLRSYAAGRGIRLMGSVTYHLPENSADHWMDPREESALSPEDFRRRWERRLAWSSRLYDITKVYRRIGEEEVFAYYAPEAIDPVEFCQTLHRVGSAGPEEAGQFTHAFQKAFGPGKQSRHLPHWYDREAVAYVGTCSDDTIRGWIKTLDRKDAQDLNDYIGTSLPRDQAWSVLRTLWASTAALVMTPVQDFLELGSAARLSGFENPADNWSWRLRRGSLTNHLAGRIARMNRLFDRI